MASNFILNAQIRVVGPTHGNIRNIISQLNNSIGNVNSNVNININTSSINRATTAINRTAQAVRHAKDSFESFGDQAALAIKRFGAFTFVTTGVFALTGAIRSAISEAIEFERQLIRVGQVTLRPTSQLGGLTGEIRRLSTGFGVSSRELLESSVVLSQAGISLDETTIALQALAKSDLAPTFDSINETAEGSVAIFSQFGITANELEGVLGSLNAVAGGFAVESGDLTTAIRRTGGAFKAAGGSLNELLALFTSVRATTRESAESIATGFRTIFTRLQRVRTINFLQQLGVDLLDDEGQFVGPMRAIEELSIALNSISSTDLRFSQIVEELGGFRQISKVIPLIQQYDVAQRALNVAVQGSESLTLAAGAAQEGLANKIQKVKEEFLEVVRAFSNNKTIRELTDIILGLASAFVKVARSLEEMTPLLISLGSIGIVRAGIPFARGFSGRFSRFNSGGMVPGTGNSDSVPAMLTPGEFVLTKEAVQRIGIGNLRRMNDVAKFNKGGLVGAGTLYNKGGLSALGAGALVILPSIADQLVGKFTELGESSDLVSDIFSSITKTGSQLLLSRTLIGSGINTQRDLVRDRRASIMQRRGEKINYINRRSDQAIADLNKNAPNLNGLNPIQRTLAQLQHQIKLDAVNMLRNRGVQGAKDNARNELRLERAKIEQLRKSEVSLNRFSTAVAATSLALNALGDIISRNATTPEGKSLGSAISTGSDAATSTAFFGAALLPTLTSLGVVTGPVGLAFTSLAAVTSGLTVGLSEYSRALAEEKENIAQADFGKTFRDLQDRVTRVSQSQSSVFREGVDIRSGVSDTRTRFIEAQGSGRDIITGQIEALLPELTTMANVVARGVESFDELERVMGTEVLDFLRDFGSFSFDEFKKSLEQTIESANRDKEVSDEVRDSLIRAAERLRDLEIISRITNDLGAKFSVLDSEMSNFANQLTNFAGNFSVFSQGDLINQFKSIGDFDRYGEVLGRSLSFLNNSVRNAGTEMTKDATEVARAATILPDILLGVSKQDPFSFGGENRLLNRLEDQLAEANIPKFIRDEIMKTAEFSIIGSEGDDTKLLSAITEDLIGTSEKMLNGFTQMFDTITNFNSLIETQLSRFADGLSARNAAELRGAEEANKVFDIFNNADQKLASLYGLSVDPRRIEDNFNRQFDTFAQGRQQDPNALANEILFRQARSRDLENQFNNTEGEARKAIINEIKNEELAISQLTQSLHLLADDSRSAASSFARLEAATRNAVGTRRLVDTQTFGSNDEIKKMTDSFRLIQAGISQQGGFQQIYQNEQARMMVGSFLNQFDPETQIGGFGGATIRDIQEQFSREAANLLASTPQEAQAFQEIINKAFNQGNEEIRARREYVAAINKAAQAQENISSIILQNSQTFEQALQDQWTNFITELRRTFAESQKADLESEKKSTEQTMKDNESRLNIAESIKNAFGFSQKSDNELNTLIEFVTGGGLDKLESERNTFGQFVDLQEAMKDFRIGISGFNEGRAYGGGNFAYGDATARSENSIVKGIADIINKSPKVFTDEAFTGVNEAQRGASKFLSDMQGEFSSLLGDDVAKTLVKNLIGNISSRNESFIDRADLLESIKNELGNILNTGYDDAEARLSAVEKQSGLDPDQLNQILNNNKLEKAIRSLEGGINTRKLEESNKNLQDEIDRLNKRILEYEQKGIAALDRNSNALENMPTEMLVNGTQTINVNVAGLDGGRLEGTVKDIASSVVLTALEKLRDKNDPGMKLPRGDEIVA